MKSNETITYLLVEDSYLIRCNLTKMMSELRPSWLNLGICESTFQIKQFLLKNPDFILSDSHLSDGECIAVLKEHAREYPIIIYTHLVNEVEARKHLSNIIKFIYEPVSREEMEDAIYLLESGKAELKFESVNQ